MTCLLRMLKNLIYTQLRNMNNKEFIAELAERTGYTPKDTQKLVDNIINAMGDAFQEDNAVAVPGFGTF